MKEYSTLRAIALKSEPFTFTQKRTMHKAPDEEGGTAVVNSVSKSKDIQW